MQKGKKKKRWTKHMIRTTEQRQHEENEVETKEDGVIMKDMIWVRTKWMNEEKALDRDGWNKTFKQEEVPMDFKCEKVNKNEWNTS